MKLFGCTKSCRLWLISLVIVLLIGEKRAIGSSGESEEVLPEGSAEDGANHDHHANHDHEDHNLDLASDEVSSGSILHDHQEHHHHDSHVKNHGESCASDECDVAKGLTCTEDVCQCDKAAGHVFSVELGKCEASPPEVVPDVKDNSLEDEDNVGSKEEAQNDQHTSHTPTTQSNIAVENKDNSVEVEDTVDKKEEEHPVLGIQHRSEGDEDEEGESEEKLNVLGGKCENVNCEETLGRYSKCDEDTGECQCNDVEGLNRPLVQVDGKCVINRHINDPCSSHDECAATIAGKAWCHMDVVTLNRFCQCEMFHYFDESHSECLPFASDGLFSPCKTDMQCTGFQVDITGHGLGPNAKCAKEKGHCECKLGPNGQKTFLYENYCFYQLMPGEFCNNDRECEVSFPGQNVSCLESHCMCKSGEEITAVSCPMDDVVSGGSRRIDGNFDFEDEDDDGSVIERVKSAMGLDMPNFVFIMIIGAVVLLVVVILSVFIVRKRHRYSMVRTRESKDEPDSPL